jgi:hypothetical protein
MPRTYDTPALRNALKRRLLQQLNRYPGRDVVRLSRDCHCFEAVALEVIQELVREGLVVSYDLGGTESPSGPDR